MHERTLILLSPSSPKDSSSPLAFAPVGWAAVALALVACNVDTGPLPGGDYYPTGGSHYPTGNPSGGGLPPASPTCSAQETMGQCSNNQLTYCDAGQTYVQACGDAGNACGWNTENAWYECQVPASTGPGTRAGSGGAGSGGSSCGAVDDVGECEGLFLSYCNDGALVSVDCQTKNGICGFDAAAGWYDCVAPPTTTTCDGVPAAGLCDGDALVTCGATGPETTDCAALGGTCAVDGSGYAGCVTTPPVSGCGDVDHVGVCDGDIVYWCDGGTLASIDCGEAGRTCGWNSDQKFNDCVDLPPMTDGCGTIDEVGTCSGDVLSYCQNGALTTVTCDDTCGWNDGAAYYDCVATVVVPVDPCGDIDHLGTCAGTTLLYCQAAGDGNALVEEQCAWGCGWDAAAGQYDCQSPVVPVDPCGGIDGVGSCDGDVLYYCQNAGTDDALLVTEDCAFGCGWNDAAGISECLPDPGPPVDPCLGIDAAGTCDGDLLYYCENAALVTKLCNFGCGWIDGAGLSECLPDPGPPIVDPCAGIDELGLCDGDLLSWCQDGALQSQVCDFGCDWSALGYYACLPAPVSECGDVDEVGVCDGATLWYCDAGALVSQTCEGVCAYDDANGYYACF